MTPWIIDAKDIEITGVSDFRESLFHSNAQISRFLNDESKEQLLVVGPKGFGKTLLLKVKRKGMERGSYTFFPEDALVDKPIGTPHIFAFRDLQDLLEKDEYWRHVWLIAIIISLLKIQRVKVGFKSVQLEGFYQNLNIISCCDMFDRVLTLSRSEYYKAYEDLRNELIPLFRKLHTPIAMFIDNVDEYFEQAIAVIDQGRTVHNVRKSYWYFAQIGLASAARELNGLNNHIKICVSIRQEVFQGLKTTDPMAMQLRGSAIEIAYDKEDIIEILKKNMAAESPSKCAEPKSSDLFLRFFGSENRFIIHTYTGEEERIEDYLMRHTLWRPRDIAIMGKRISDIDPARRTIVKLREVINQTAAFIAETYLTECRPHIANLREEVLYPLLPSNIFNRDTLEEISRVYNDSLNIVRDSQGEQNHVFWQLYRLGLLGYVKHGKKSDSSMQYFSAPGEQPLDNEGAVPHAHAYLIHPILYERIAKYNHVFFDRLDHLNIVGRGRPWRELADILFVVKGDVVNYSEIMKNADLADVFPMRFSEMLEAEAGNLLHCEIIAGDSLLLIDRNPHNVLKSAKEIMERMKSSMFEKTLRFGGDAGVVRYETVNRKMTNLRGGALRTAARLEAVGLSDAIVVTDRFVKNAELLQANGTFKAIGGSELPNARTVGDMFNLAKNDSEESILHKLFRYEASD
jgi:hypothetical protein